MLRTSNFTEINLTSNYAPTAQVCFTIKDANGSPVPGARVDFKIYNYAEFYTAVTKYTDQQGHVSLSAGIGDLLVWASKDGKYGYQKASFGKDKTITIQLNRDAQTDSKQLIFPEETIDVVPPVESAKMPYVSDEMRKENNPQAGQVGRELLERDHTVITDYGLLRRKDGGQLPVFQPEHQENEITGPAFAGM